jgi:SAM-dependent methyltransferase
MRPLVPAGARLLDVGCGNGAFLKAAAEAGYQVAGIEQNAGSIALAAERSGERVTDLGTALAAAERYDIVHLADLLSHLPQPAEVLRALEGLLAPGGLFLIEGPLEKQRNPVYLALLAASRLRRRRGRHAPLHLSFIDWRSQRALFERRLGYRLVASDLYETGWPFSTSAAGGGLGARGKAAIARFAIVLSRSPLGRPLGAFNRFRALLEPSSRS